MSEDKLRSITDHYKLSERAYQRFSEFSIKNFNEGIDACIKFIHESRLPIINQSQENYIVNKALFEITERLSQLKK